MHSGLDGKIQNEQYVLHFLIPYIDRHFRTIAERAGRVVDGLSNGGYGSMHFAAKAPDRFVAAGAMSSNLDAISFTGLGDAVSSPAYRHGNMPVDLVENLDGVDLTMDIGTLCITDKVRDNCITWAFEQTFLPANRAFSARVTAIRGADDGAFEYRETEGGHSWTWWPLWLRERHLPFFLARLSDPHPLGTPTSPPVPRPSFRYRSIAPEFSVWGYDVHVQRSVREFLDLSDVRADGLVVQGSGQVTIHTAAVYRPRHGYTISGAGGVAQHVKADAAGHIEIAVDLGPSHQNEQYSPAANALEAAGDYWIVRDVGISEE